GPQSFRGTDRGSGRNGGIEQCGHAGNLQDKWGLRQEKTLAARSGGQAPSKSSADCGSKDAGGIPDEQVEQSIRSVVFIEDDERSLVVALACPPFSSQVVLSSVVLDLPTADLDERQVRLSLRVVASNHALHHHR